MTAQTRSEFALSRKGRHVASRGDVFLEEVESQV